MKRRYALRLPLARLHAVHDCEAPDLEDRKVAGCTCQAGPLPVTRRDVCMVWHVWHACKDTCPLKQESLRAAPARCWYAETSSAQRKKEFGSTISIHACVRMCLREVRSIQRGGRHPRPHRGAGEVLCASRHGERHHGPESSFRFDGQY